MPHANAEGDIEAVVKRLVRDIPDYPKPGILFKDVTPLLADADAFAGATQAMSAPFAKAGITHVVAIESRGFILGGPVAEHLRAGFVPVRKPGKLPFDRVRQEYELEYGTDSLEIHADACDHHARILIVDDVLATGGTAQATRALVERLGGHVAGFSFLLALGFLSGMQRLKGENVHAVATY